MGLDMYLTEKIYIGSQYKHRKVDAKVEIKIADREVNLKEKDIKSISVDAAYWRKANHIHKWFVDNVQDGNDDCEEYEVSRAKLQELVDVCKKVKAATKLVPGKVNNGYTFKNGKQTPIIEEGLVVENSEVADELLPTESGFFFGNTGYNEYYMQDIDDTIEQIEKALENADEDSEFYYRSSW